MFPCTGTDILSDMFFFYPGGTYPKQNGFPVSENTLVLKQGHQLQTAKNSQRLLSVSNWELEPNNNNYLILILHAFHEMIKRALHDFYL